MVPMSKVKVRVPASTANLGPGFDSLGMALNLYVEIEMSLAEKTTIILQGANVEGLPTDKSNLIFKVAQQVFDKVGLRSPELRIEMKSEIPLARGLGSSAAAIIGGMVAANALCQNPLSQDDLLQMATRIEQHPDNVAASLYGGIVVSSWSDDKAEVIRIEPDERLEVLAVIPDFQLSTIKARNVLPHSVPFQDAIYNVSHASLLVAALLSGRLDMIGRAMKDRLHQPYRSLLVPGMSTILEQAMEYGALGIALSGAGPTVLALVDTNQNDKERLQKFMEHSFQAVDISTTSLWLKPCSTGAQVLTQHVSHSTFIDDVTV